MQAPKEELLAKIQQLASEADKLPDGKQRRQLVDEIAALNVAYQVED
jgi:hypothetical protein